MVHAALVVIAHSSGPISIKGLLKASDGEAYKLANFSEERLRRFRVFIVTLQRFPDPLLLDTLAPMEILPAQSV